MTFTSCNMSVVCLGVGPLPSACLANEPGHWTYGNMTVEEQHHTDLLGWAKHDVRGFNGMRPDPTMLCAGTLTLNKLSVDSATVLCLGGHSVEEILKLSALSSQIDSEEAIDLVLVESYHGKAGLWDGLKQTKFVPFNPVDKYTISHVTETNTNNSYRLLKGAPQVGTSPPSPP